MTALIRKALINSGCKTAKVDEMIKIKGKAPESLVGQWEDLVKEDAKARF